MAGPLIATKLYLPKPRRGLVTRQRLLERLRHGSDSRLTLVSAPAGFGKTTLLADWLHKVPDADRCVAWLSLDSADNEPSAFWTYVVTALQRVVPSVDLGALELIRSSPRSTDLMLTRVLNDVAAVSREVWLVLDDYHVLDDQEIGRSMAFLLQHLPDHVHVVLSTRADPDLPLARWRARGELVEIRAADLRFTSDEAAAYLNEVTGLGLDATDVEALEARTEGWIAALQLAALSLQGRDDASGFIAQFAGNDRYLVDYLVEEVLAHQPEAVRDFLLRSSVLERLTGSLCDAVVGRDDSTEMLLRLERANLFLVALDDQRSWFRYHHLFADVLRARLLAEQPDLVAVLHRSAGLWYEAHDAHEEAIRHALAAQDVGRAVRLMELAVPAIRRDRREATLLGWLRALPDDAVRRSPVLSVFSGYMLMVSGDLDAFEARLDDADRALAAAPEGSTAPWDDTAALRSLPATIAVYRASIAQARGDVAGTADHARHALGLAGPDDHLARGSAAAFVGLAAWAKGDVPSALETFAVAVASLHAAGNLVDELSSTVILADMWIAAGRPSVARRLYERALLVAAEHESTTRRATPDLHVGLSELDYEAGNLAAAHRHLEIAAALAQGAVTTESRYRWFMARARVASAEDDPQRAVALLDEAAQLYRPGFFPDVRPIAALKARIWITHGRLSEASAWARERGVTTSDDPTYLSEFDHLTLVRLLIAQYRAHPRPGGLGEALRLLARLGDAAESSGRDGSLVEIELVSALAQDAQGDRPQALDALDRVWTVAPEPDGTVRLFLDEGSPMTDLLRAADQRGLAHDRARRLLDLAAAPGADAIALRPRRVPTPDALSERELQVLRLLDSELTGPQIARELFITLNTLRSHTKRIFTKLEVTTRRAAVSQARERGLM